MSDHSWSSCPTCPRYGLSYTWQGTSRPEPARSLGESTFFLKEVVTLSKPYLLTLGAKWIVKNLSSRLGLKPQVPDH